MPRGDRTGDAGSDATPSIPGVTLGSVLGEGGFGRVYRGRHTALDIDVAVKVLDVSGAAPAERRQLLLEAQLMARLDHPNLLRVFDAGSLDRHLYLVLEFMDDGSCSEMRSLPAVAAVDASRQLLSGLQALHDARMLHRDIKPANCLKRKDARIKLADLGLAVEVSSRTSAAMSTAGTIPFMAPELFETPPRFGARSDLYALGMTLATFALEERPYPVGSLTDVLPWILNGPRRSVSAYRPDLPHGVSALIDRMISPRVEERPETASQALADLSVDGPPTLRTLGPALDVTIGPWIVGASIYSSGNWDGWAVTHGRTGAAGRLMRLTVSSPLRQATALVLRAAERAVSFDDRFIVPVLDWGLWEDRAYVVTAARGHTIEELVRGGGCVDEVSALGFARDLAEALRSLHAQGLVYQNLDPGSAVIAYHARSAQLSWPVYCVEAGSDATTRILVPRYAAPEAMVPLTRTIEPAVDVFGLGAALLYMLTAASPPRDGPRVADFVRTHAPDTTAATCALVSELLEPSPERRPTADIALAKMAQILARLRPLASGDVKG